MKIFDAHSDIWENVDEKRVRGLNCIIETYHKPEWEKADVFAGFYPVWVDPYSKITPVDQVFRIIKHMANEIHESKNHIQICTSYNDILMASKEQKHAIILGSEGLSYIGEDVELLDLLYYLGMRTMSLTWNESNKLATGPDGDPDKGLTEVGRACVKKMKKLNVLIDLSHTNEQTFWDIMELTTSPVIVSHGNSRSIYDKTRNYTDAQLRAIAKRGGVIGLNAFPQFIAEKKIDRNVSELVNHLDHMIGVMGVEHVGFGLDLVDFLDDYGTDPTISEATIGLETISQTHNLIKEIKNRGYNDEQLAKITHKNFLRVIKDVIG